MYVALIADIVRSREIEKRERSRVQRGLERALKKVNLNPFLGEDIVYKFIVVSNFIITTGDEFQGLLKEGSNPLRVLRFIQTFLGDKPRIRFGIGRGELVTGIKPTAVGMDGECFYNARDALNAAKAENVTCKAKGFGDFDGKKDLDAVINMLLENLFLLYWDLPPMYRKIYNLRYIKGSGVKEIQRRLGYSSDRYVYKVISDPRSKQMIRNELAVADLFVYKDIRLPSVGPDFP